MPNIQQLQAPALRFFDCQKDWQIEDERVAMRPLLPSDLDHLLELSLCEPELWAYTLQSAAGFESLYQYLHSADLQRRASTSYPFIIFDKKLDRYAGSTRFYELNPQNDTLRLGYTWYGKAHQSSGLNQHCKLLLLDFAFEIMGAMRVEFRVDVANDRSIKALKGIGCVEEGLLRSSGVRHDGTRRDTLVLSILIDEWYNSLREKLWKKMIRFD